MSSRLQIIDIIFVIVRFLLETHPVICIRLAENQPEDPFEEVDDVEEHIQEFLHLRRVDGFVVKVLPGQLVPMVIPDEHQPEQVDAEEPAKRDYIVEDGLHV